MRSPTTSGRICRRAGLFTALAAVSALAVVCCRCGNNLGALFRRHRDSRSRLGNQHAGAEPNTGQTAVSWTSTTTFSQTATASLSALSVGSCVTVSGHTRRRVRRRSTPHPCRSARPRRPAPAPAGSAEPAQAASAASAGWVGRRDSTVLRWRRGPERHISAPLPTGASPISPSPRQGHCHEWLDHHRRRHFTVHPAGRVQVDKVVQEANDAQDDHRQGRDVIVDHLLQTQSTTASSLAVGDCVSASGPPQPTAVLPPRRSGSPGPAARPARRWVPRRCRLRWMSSRARVDGSGLSPGRSRRCRCRGSSGHRHQRVARPQVGAPPIARRR